MTCKLCADHEEHGTLKERERIIKLLIDRYQHRDFDGNRLDNPHNDNLDDAIALIKGEQK